MSLYGLTKGTEIQELIDTYMKDEAKGVVMYYSLAFLAREQGMDDLAETLERIAQDEARHAALYSILNAEVNDNLLLALTNIQMVESNAVSRINDFAKRVHVLGLTEAAEQIEKLAQDEEQHSRILKEILEKQGL